MEIRKIKEQKQEDDTDEPPVRKRTTVERGDETGVPVPGLLCDVQTPRTVGEDGWQDLSKTNIYVSENKRLHAWPATRGRAVATATRRAAGTMGVSSETKEGRSAKRT